jgi:hypothetical protein
MPIIIQHTNDVLRRDSLGADTNKGEMLQWHGIRLCMAVEQVVGGVEECWRTKEDMKDTVLPAPDYHHRFGMSAKRFKNLSQALRLSPDTNAQDRDDPWQPVRSAVDGFNRRRFAALKVGANICIDESMCAWRPHGGTNEFVVDAMPHQTKIIRKPEGVGLEAKTAACTETGIIIAIDLVEGKEAQHAKKFHEEYGEGTAVTLRLTENYFGSGRIVTGDSAFASVKTGVACGDRGLEFQGMCKTAHKLFPKAFLTAWVARENTAEARWGNFMSCTAKAVSAATGKTYPLLSVAWRDKKAKYIIATRGTTLAGNPHVKYRHRIVEREDYYHCP